MTRTIYNSLLLLLSAESSTVPGDHEESFLQTEEEYRDMEEQYIAAGYIFRILKILKNWGTWYLLVVFAALQPYKS